MLVTAVAQTRSDTQEANSERTLLGGSAREGFTLRGTEVVMTRGGVTTKVDREILLPNGLRVLANGNVVLRNGTTTSLHANQLLTFDGNFQDVLLTPEGVAPVSSVDPGPASKVDPGISPRDGVFLSGTDVFITRGGITEKVDSDVRLTNGTIVHSSGMIELSNGNRISLRASQFLDLNGVVHDLPAGVTLRPAARR